MSSAKRMDWLTPMLFAVVAGLVVYGTGCGVGNCPANIPPANTPLSAEISSPVPSSEAAPATSIPERTLVHADEGNFEAILKQSKGPVLVDFYADWCGPCQRLAPVLERVSEDLTDARIVKVNVDDNPQLASRYKVQALPTLVVFNDGQIVKRSMGLHDESEIRQLLQ